MDSTATLVKQRHFHTAVQVFKLFMTLQYLRNWFIYAEGVASGQNKYHLFVPQN